MVGHRHVDFAAADRALRVSQLHATRVVAAGDHAGQHSMRSLLEVLRGADRRLAEVLRRSARHIGGLESRFGVSQAAVYRAQIGVVTRQVEARLAGLTEAQSAHAVAEAAAHTVGLLRTMERRFTGIVAPLPIDAVSILAGARANVVPSLLRMHATSVDRYGLSMIGEFERRIAVGMASGMTQGQMVDLLCEHAGPRGVVSLAAREIGSGRVKRIITESIAEGLFARYRSWAWRIVRTETSRAYNLAKEDAIWQCSAAGLDGMRKKILAHFDDRTAEDSVYVHGQVKAQGELFVDGAGRQYTAPPGRPNDRETLIPWRAHWPETASSRPLSPSEVQERVAALGTKRAGELQRAMKDRPTTPRSISVVVPVQLASVVASPPPPEPPPRLRRVTFSPAMQAAIDAEWAAQDAGGSEESATGDNLIRGWIKWSNADVAALGELFDATLPEATRQRILERAALKLGDVRPATVERAVIRQYVSTQRALRDRGLVDADGNVLVYRGVIGELGTELHMARQERRPAQVAFRGFASTSTRYGMARSFAHGPDGHVMRLRVPAEEVFAHHGSNEQLERRNEAEVIVLSPQQRREVAPTDAFPHAQREAPE